MTTEWKGDDAGNDSREILRFDNVQSKDTEERRQQKGRGQRNATTVEDVKTRKSRDRND
jgi:hypothetical protein